MDIDIDDEHLEMINFLMKAMILAATIFFVLAFVVYFFGLLPGAGTLSSEETLFKLSPVIILLLILSVIFNLTRYRCPECRTFIKRRTPCPVCKTIKEGRTAKREEVVDEKNGFLDEDDSTEGRELETDEDNAVDTGEE